MRAKCERERETEKSTAKCYSRSIHSASRSLMPRTLWNSFNAFDCKQWNLQAMHEMHEIQLEDQSPWHSYIIKKYIN